MLVYMHGSYDFFVYDCHFGVLNHVVQLSVSVPVLFTLSVYCAPCKQAFTDGYNHAKNNKKTQQAF